MKFRQLSGDQSCSRSGPINRLVAVTMGVWIVMTLKPLDKSNWDLDPAVWAVAGRAYEARKITFCWEPVDRNCDTAQLATLDTNHALCACCDVSGKVLFEVLDCHILQGTGI